MFRNLIIKTFRFTWKFGLFGFFVFGLIRIVIILIAVPHTFPAEDVPVRRVAIVFGAQVRRNGTPSAVLRDRVQTAVDLYKNGKVEKILMSGDNRFVDYNEPESMRQYAVSLGVPNEAIVLDYAGRRTYDTCYRAREIFHVDSVILVTQGFHLPRALFLCNSFNLEAVGVKADNYYYLKRLRLFWNIRETLATMQAVWDVYVRRPLPVLGEPEPIFAMK